MERYLLKTALMLCAAMAAAPAFSAADAAKPVPAAMAGDPAVAKPSPEADSASKHETIEHMKANLDSLGERIDELNAKMRLAGNKARKESKEDLDRLQRAKNLIAARLDTLGQTTSGAWRKMKARAGREIDSLKADVERVRRKNKD
jgi:TolA-binding protein